MAYQNKPGFFMVQETRRVFAYDDLLSAEGETVSMDTINHLFGVSKPSLLCMCHPIEPIPMHFQRHRVSDTVAHFWDNRNNQLTHTAECPRAKSEDVQQARQNRRTLPGVQWTMDEEGHFSVDVNIDPFAEVEEDRGVKEVSGSIDTSESKDVDDGPEAKKVKTARSSTGGKRGQSEFGGLVRAWYEIARAYANEHARTRDEQRIDSSKLTMSNLLWAMMRVRFSHDPKYQFTIAGKSAEQYAYIPLKKAESTRRVGEQRIIAGRLKWLRQEQLDIRCGIEGVNAVWDVLVPESLATTITESRIGELAVFRGVYEHGECFIGTHKPFFAIIGEPGAVWMDSGLERKTYHELRKRNFIIEKPMHESDEFFGFRPDFVLRDFRLPVVIEVFGMKGNAKYNDHKQVKRSVYRKAMQQGFIWYLEWDDTVKGDWERFIAELDRLEKSTG